VTVTATAYTHYAFDHWLLDGAKVYDNPINVTMNSDHTLEAYFAKPVCAMKTSTGGYFYVPNIATSRVKVEMLFDNRNITGDQTGGTSPYPAIKRWPDGFVDGLDTSFISSLFGRSEGESGWDYMADVCPDRYIDGLDIGPASRNYGKSGTYIADLTGVTVTFNTGQSISPDSDGFVVIPQGATSLTVKRSGNPIGAVITFWGPA